MSKSKTYKQKTRILGIPVLGFRDRIDPDIEMKRWTIVENQLLAATSGVSCRVFEEGDFSVVEESDKTFKVCLSGTGQRKALVGTVRGIYFEVSNYIEWTGLKRGYSYNIYVSGSTRLFANPFQVRAGSSTHFGNKEKSKTLVAKVRWNAGEDEYNLDLHPKGKIFSGDLAKHLGVTHNPHGPVLSQDRIEADEVIADRIVLKGDDGKASEITGSDVKIKVFKINAPGEEGVVVSVPEANEVLMAHSSSSCGLTSDAFFGYNREDPKCLSASDVMVYSKGDASTIRFAVYYR